MKALKLSLVIMAATMIAMGVTGVAYAFHGGGVADCSGCHQMHNAPSSSFLLIKSDPSSTCLSCHMHPGDTGPSSYHSMTADADMPTGSPPLQRPPGGDFGWLKKTYTWQGREQVETETGDSHGHNIIAADYGYAVDGTKSTAPGGTFVSANLSCITCHDMHGEYRRDINGNVGTGSANLGPITGTGSTGTIPTAGTSVGVYRLLWGANPSTTGIPAYPGVPAAVAPSSYNRSEVTYQTRVAYGLKSTGGHATWGNWCGTCHAGMLSGGTNHTHPEDQALTGAKATNYSNYVSSGNMTGNFSGSFQLGQGPFTSLAPFILAQSDYATLKTYASSSATTGLPLNGPSGTDQVACQSCHRSHASGFKSMLRWDSEAQFLTYVDSAGTVSWPGTGLIGISATTAKGRTPAETKAAYYDRDPRVFGAYQRSLCNKCHVKD